jgi:hypothetical protein
MAYYGVSNLKVYETIIGGKLDQYLDVKSTEAE